MKEIPVLAEYEDCWPAADFMIVHLKNTKQRVKSAKIKGKERAVEREIESEDDTEEDAEDE